MRRRVELATITIKDRTAAKERKFVKEGSKNITLIMAIGDAVTGVGSTIKGYDRRGGKWLANTHARYEEVRMTDEYMTSQLCVYCYFPIVHAVQNGKTILGSARCMNPACIAFKNGNACNNRDIMSATAIGISGATKFLFNKNFHPFTRSNL